MPTQLQIFEAVHKFHPADAKWIAAYEQADAQRVAELRSWGEVKPIEIYLGKLDEFSDDQLHDIGVDVILRGGA